MRVSAKELLAFEQHLRENERSPATVARYLQAVKNFSAYLDDRPLSKTELLSYREALLRTKTVQTVNGALSAINGFLGFAGRADCRVKLLKVQRKAFLEECRELSQKEYKRLLDAAKGRGNQRLYLVMLTLGSTGIRVSELVYITVEAARMGQAEIRLKGKCRRIILQKELRQKLLGYAKRRGIETGHIFRTRTGRPLDRSNLWQEMKKLCEAARVDRSKVFPHSFRHLFARSFYAVEKDLAHLADLLGHSRVETTRIYVAASVSSHRKALAKMRLVI